MYIILEFFNGLWTSGLLFGQVRPSKLEGQSTTQSKYYISINIARQRPTHGVDL